MNNIRATLARVPWKDKTTLGRLDEADTLSTPIRGQLYRTAVVPLQSSEVCWKREHTESYEHWDGLYALDRFYKRKDEGPVYDSKGSSPFIRCWNAPVEPIPEAEARPAIFPHDILSPLTDLVRSELEKLPADLAVWNKERAPPYCGGIGG
jgi:hypothetical protein